MDIYEEIGCLPAFYNSVPSLIIITIPPLVMATISLFYAGKINSLTSENLYFYGLF